MNFENGRGQTIPRYAASTKKVASPNPDSLVGKVSATSLRLGRPHGSIIAQAPTPRPIQLYSAHGSSPQTPTVLVANL